MNLLAVCFPYLLLTCLVLPKAECRLHDGSVELRNPDIDPSWYTGRGIRPVGRFGRRRATLEDYLRTVSGRNPTCFPVEESNESTQDE